MQNPQDVQLAANALKSQLPDAFFASVKTPVGIIMGTGLSSSTFGAKLTEIPFSALPGFPVSGVESHTGSFAAGLCNGLPILVQKGRCHLYEGKSPAQVCMGVRVMAEVGCATLIITNAAGALNPLFAVPGLMCICDMINHTGISPLTGPNCDSWGDRFPDMSAPFDASLIGLTANAALKLGIALEKGVYIGVHGPEMETPAETRMYRQWGADAVGMSTVLEVIAARHLSLRCLGISCLTNKNLPDCMAPAPLADIINAANRTGPALWRLLTAVLEGLAGYNEPGTTN